MRKLFLCVFSITLFIQSCSLNDDFFDKQSVLKKEIEYNEISLPDDVENYGRAVAKEIRATVQKLNDMNIDYSEADGSKEFRDKFYKEWYDANPTISSRQISGLTMSSMMDAAEFAERYNELTEIQLKFIQYIVEECTRSISNQDLLNKLCDIKEQICVQVPEIEQERLLNIISVLYYAIKEISYLEDQGLMFRTPYTDIQLANVKTRTEGGSVVPSGCRKFLATVWTIAVGEPTPAGEIVASVVTVVTLSGVVMYEVVTCAAKELEKDDCTQKFVDCINSGGSWSNPNSGGWGRTMCEVCYRYCEAQGVWDCPRPTF